MTDQTQVQTSDSGMLTQIFAGVTDIKTDVAVMKEQLKALPDHERRIRTLESSKAKMMGAVTLLGALSGSAGGAIIGWALTHR